MKPALRFQNLLPANAQPISPVPLVSPSQQDRGSKQVLHSIFSPLISVDHSMTHQTTHNTSNLHIKSTRATNRHGKEIFPAPKIATLEMKPDTVVFSPAQNTHVSSLASPLSVMTRYTDVSRQSYKGLPSIDMISLDYIKRCQDLDDLNQIIDVLKTEPRCTALMNVALDRKKNLHQYQSRTESMARQGTRVTFQQNILPPQTSQNIPQERSYAPSPRNTSRNDSSLFMSLSSDEDELTDMPPPLSRPPSKLLGRDRKLFEEINFLTSSLQDMQTDQRRQHDAFIKRVRDLEMAKHSAEMQLRALENTVSTSNVTCHELSQQLEKLRNENESMKTRLKEEENVSRIAMDKAEIIEKQLSAKLAELNLQQAKRNQHVDPTLERKNRELNSLLQSTQWNLEHVMKERDAMIRSLLNASGQTAAELKKLSIKERSAMISSFANSMKSSKATLDAMVSRVTTSEQDRIQCLKSNEKMEARLRALVRSKNCLETENCTLLQKIQSLTSQISESRAHAKKLLQSTRCSNEQEWRKREAAYVLTIDNLKRRIRKEDTMVPVELYKSAVEEARRLSLNVAKLQQQLNCLRSTTYGQPDKAPEKDSSGLASALESQKSRGSVSFATPKSRCLSLRMRHLSPTNDLSCSRPEQYIQPKIAVHKSLAPSEITVSRSRRRSKGSPQNGSDENTAPQQVPVIPSKTGYLPAAKFSFSPKRKADDRHEMRVKMVRAVGGRKGLQDKLKKVRSPRERPTPLKTKN
jgi:myosin heavy subunit